MADETLNQEDKIVNEGSRTLGEVVYSLPIVKYLMTTLPEKLSNFNFIGSVTTELSRKKFRAKDSYQGSTLLTQEEIDFITREGIGQIEDRISEDISNEKNGIVIVGGKIDDEASFAQQEANEMTAADAGQYFVEIKKERAAIESALSTVEYFTSFDDLQKEFLDMDNEFLHDLKEIAAGNIFVDEGSVDAFSNYLNSRASEERKKEENSPENTRAHIRRGRGVFGDNANLTKEQLQSIGSVDIRIILEKNRIARTSRDMTLEDGIEKFRRTFNLSNMTIETKKLLFSYIKAKGISEAAYRELTEMYGLVEFENLPREELASFLKNTENACLMDSLEDISLRYKDQEPGERTPEIDIDELRLILYGLSKNPERNLGVAPMASALAKQLGIPVPEGEKIPLDEIREAIFKKYRYLTENLSTIKPDMSPSDIIEMLATEGRKLNAANLEHDIQLEMKQELDRKKEQGNKITFGEGIDREEIKRRTEIAYVTSMAQRRERDIKDLTDEDKEMLYISIRRSVLYEEFVNNPNQFSLEDKIEALALVRNTPSASKTTDDAIRKVFRKMLFDSIRNDLGGDVLTNRKAFEEMLELYKDLYSKKVGSDKKLSLGDIQKKLFEESIDDYRKIEDLQPKIEQKRTILEEERIQSYENANLRSNYREMMKEAVDADDYITIAGRGLESISTDRKIKSLMKLISMHEKFGTTYNSQDIDYDETVEKYKQLNTVMEVTKIIRRDDKKVTDKDLLYLMVYLSDFSHENDEEYKLRNLVAAKVSKVNPDLIKPGKLGRYDFNMDAFKKLGRAAYGDSVKSTKDIMDHVREDEYERMKKQLDDLHKPLTQKDRQRLAKREYRETFAFETVLLSEFREADINYSKVLDIKILRTIKAIEGIGPGKERKQLSKEELEEFHKELKIYMMNRQIKLKDVAKSREALTDAKHQSVIMKYINDHALELLSVQPDYGNLGFFERTQFNHYDEDYKSLKRQVHLEALKSGAVNLLTSEDTKKFGIPNATEKIILEAIACCLVDSRDPDKNKNVVRDILKGKTKKKSDKDPDIEKLEAMIPYLNKISKKLVTVDKDGNQIINEPELIEYYAMKTGRVVKTVRDIAEFGEAYSNKQYEEVTSREIASRNYELHVERWVAQIVNSDMTPDEKRAEIAKLTKNIHVTDSRSKVATLFISGKIERNLSSEPYQRQMYTIADDSDSKYRGTTSLADSYNRRRIDEERAIGLLQDSKAMNDLSSNEKKLISHYIENGLESEDVEEAYDTARKFLDFDTLGQDVVKQIYMIKQAELIGPEATERYMEEHPDYDAFLDEGAMSMSISLLRAGVMSKLEKGLKEESPKISNEAINVIIHSIHYSSSHKNITGLALEYAKKFISPEELEACIVVTKEGRRRINDEKLITALEDKLMQDPDISNEEKTKFERGNYKERDLAEERAISREISEKAREYLIRSGIKEEDLPIMGEFREEKKSESKKTSKKAKERAPKQAEVVETEGETIDETTDKIPETTEEVEENKVSEDSSPVITDKDVAQNFVEEEIRVVQNNKGEVTAIIGGETIVPAELAEETEEKIKSGELDGFFQKEEIHMGKNIAEKENGETPVVEAEDVKKKKQGGTEIEEDDGPEIG